jgi:4'-phosphopantetheinyl transferase
MMAKIRLDLCQIEELIKIDPKLERKETIVLRKQAIYKHRNHLISRYLGQQISSEDILQDAYGKPYLKEGLSLHFNHSHSQKHYVFASSQRVSGLGVDIEDLDRQVRFDALAKHAFHPEELQRWAEQDYDIPYWFKVWTTKEAVLKASGLGIRLNLKELNTQAHPEHIGGMCQHPQIGHFAYQHYVLPSVMLTVAWAAEASCKGFNFPDIELHSTLTQY